MRATIGIGLFGLVLVIVAGAYVQATLTKALDHTFDDLANGFDLDPTGLSDREKSLFHGDGVSDA